MASSEFPRGSSKRIPTMNSSKAYPPSSRLDFPDSGSELQPQDSASNAPQRRKNSSSHGQNGAYQAQESRVDRAYTSMRTTTQTRIRSPTRATRDITHAFGHRRDSPKTTPGPFLRPDAIPPRRQRRAIPLWKPQVSLVEHSLAPLATRISKPPLASQLPDHLQPVPLAGMSIERQEKSILEDLLFVFMGYEGQYIRFTGSYKASEEKDRLVGPGFHIIPGLDPSIRDLASMMLPMATHYIAVEAFVEVHGKEEFGSINHALCASIRKLVTEYLSLMVQMEEQLLTDPSFTLHVLHLHILPMIHMMLQLFTLAQEMLRKNKSLSEDPDSGDDFDVDDIIEQLRDGADPTAKKIYKGGNVLRLLAERLSFMSGDPAARKLLQGLLRDASKPYMCMLNEWLHHGGIKDPHGEFLIKEQRSINRERLEEDYTDEYWEKRYTIRENDVPPQLEGVKDKILLAGKYLNVVRECGGVDVGTEVQDVPLSFDDPRFLSNINSAYTHANSSLLNLLLTTHALPARLRSMKHYFFLDRSDFFSYFLYLSNSELKKNVKDVNVGKLQSLLDLVLRQPGSVAAQDPYKEDVKIHMNDQNLTKFLMGVVNVRGFEDGVEESMERRRGPSTKEEPEEDNKMTGFDALEFRYSVPFPLSLVISSKTVVRYQILFRYLLSMRHLEDLITSTWEDHHKIVSWTHKSGDRKLEMWKRRAWTLRARMLSFVQQCMYYCTSEVIEPNWQHLMAKVNGTDKNGKALPHVTRTVDELMEDHVDFLDTCLKECMLMNAKLLRIHDKLMYCCTMFATYTSRLSRDLCSADASLAGTPKALALLATFYPSARRPIPDKQKTFDPEGLARMSDMLDNYERNFNKHLKILLDVLDYCAATETVALSRLCAQLSGAREKEGGE